MLNTDDLKQLLVDIRYQYTRSGITGMMLYSKGTFFQALEGEEEQLKKAFERLKTDDIQKGVIKLKSGSEDRRTFLTGRWDLNRQPKMFHNSMVL
jgi:hypothetical protein